MHRLDAPIPAPLPRYTETASRTALALGPVVALSFTAAYALMGEHLLAAGVGVCALLYSIFAWLAHRWGPTIRLRWAFLSLTALSLTCVVNLVGGATTIHAAWLTVYPVLAWLLLERRHALVHASVFALSVLLTLGLAVFSPELGVAPRPEYRLWFEIFSFLMYTAAAVACVAVAMGQSSSARERLELLNARLEEENRTRRQAEARAIEAAEAQARFLATMSHEIRTPLHGLLGLTELVLTRDIDEQARRWVASALSSGTHLSAIVDDVLDLSKLDAGALSLEAVPIDFVQLLEECAATLQRPAADKGLALVVDIDPHASWMLEGDPTRLRQVVLNLMGNAIKFTREGQVALSARREGADVCIDVSDTGVGIPADILPRLFLPFEQASLSTTRRHGGTGLGLAIVRRLVEMMDGEISLHSEVGRGTTASVRIRLPAAQPVLALAADGPTLADRPTRVQGRVLVVDDEPVNLIVAEAALELLGVDVTTASTGTEAIDRALSEDFDLVLMDGHMPDMDGYQAASIIQARIGDNAPPIVAFTASTTADAKARAAASGMVGMLPKPLPADALHELLARWLPASPGPEDSGTHPLSEVVG